MTKHLITCFLNPNAKSLIEFDHMDVEIECPVQKVRREKIKQTIEVERETSSLFNIGNLPKMNLKLDESLDVSTCSNLELLKLLPMSIEFSHSYTRYVARFAYFNNISFDQFYNEFYIKKANTRERKTKWANHWEKLNLSSEVS